MQHWSTMQQWSTVQQHYAAVQHGTTRDSLIFFNKINNNAWMYLEPTLKMSCCVLHKVSVGTRTVPSADMYGYLLGNTMVKILKWVYTCYKTLSAYWRRVCHFLFQISTNNFKNQLHVKWEIENIPFDEQLVKSSSLHPIVIYIMPNIYDLSHRLTMLDARRIVITVLVNVWNWGKLSSLVTPFIIASVVVIIETGHVC